MNKANDRAATTLLLLAAAFLALFMLKGALVAPPPIDAGAEFDAARAIGRLTRILGDERPHPVDSDANDAVRARLLAEIEAIGYTPQVRDDFSCRARQRDETLACARVRNVVFRAGPAAGKAIMVAAHYDSVAAGPGAADDGAGVAAALEIAAILRARRPVKAVIFLLTDGEEEGLLGAASFVRRDPLAAEIAAVINMEARGVRGPALLFQTSDPNSRDLYAYADRVKAPSGNSLASDVYKRLPNDTDLTEFLPLGVDALNLAFSDGLAFYHTPKDNLANLDRRSVAHLGGSALAALDGFLNLPSEIETAKEMRVVYGDALGRMLIVAPRIAGMLMILFAMLAAAAAYFRLGGRALSRAAAAPAAAMAIAGLLSFLAFALLGALRAEDAYWSAHPAYARAVIYAAAVAGGVAAMALAAGEDRRRLLAAAWFWFSAIGTVAYFAAPGTAMATGVPAALFAAAALASAGAPRLLAPLSLLGASAAIIIFAPLLHVAEYGLGLGAAWPFAIVGALLFMLVAPVATPTGAIRPLFAATPLAALLAATVLTLTANAYSAAAPAGVNILHVMTKNEAAFVLSPRRAVPPGKAAAERFKRRAIEGLEGERFAAPAPAHGGRAVSIEIVSSAAHEFGRTLVLRVAANGADEVMLIAPPEAGLREARAADATLTLDGESGGTIRCAGRSCATFEVTIVVAGASAAWEVFGVRHGLDASAAEIVALRPAFAVPVHLGDARVVLSKASL